MTSTLRNFLFACIALLTLTGVPVLHAQAAEANATLDANKNMTHATAASIKTTTQAMGLSDEQGMVTQFKELKDRYNKTGAPFLDGTLNVGLSRILSNGAFKTIYWSFALMFAGFAAAGAMKKAMGGSNPLGDLATLSVKLTFGAVLISARGLIYALLVTIMTSMSTGLRLAREAGITPSTIDVGIADSDFDKARIEITQIKANTAGLALAQMGEKHTNATELEKAYKFFHDGLAPQLAAAGIKTGVTDANIPASAEPVEKARIYGDWMASNVPVLISQLGALPKGTTLNVSGGGASGTIPALMDRTPKANAILAEKEETAGPQAATLHRDRVERYRATLDYELDEYVNNTVLAPLASESWWSRVGSLFSTAKNAVMSTMNSMTPTALVVAGIDAFIKVLGYVQLIFASAITFVACTLIEAQLFVMALMFPLWLFPSTEGAFTAPIRASIGAALWLPAFQLIMMIVAGLYGGLLKAIVIGTGSLAGAMSTYGQSQIAAATIGAGGLTLATLLLAFSLIYFFIVLVTALKTPSMVAKAMKGGNVAGEFLMKQATTAMEGVMLAGAIGAGVLTAGAGTVAVGAGAAGAGAAGAGSAGAAGAGAAGAAGAGAAGAGASGAGAAPLAATEIAGSTAVAQSQAPSASMATNVASKSATTPPPLAHAVEAEAAPLSVSTPAPVSAPASTPAMAEAGAPSAGSAPSANTWQDERPRIQLPRNHEKARQEQVAQEEAAAQARAEAAAKASTEERARAASAARRSTASRFLVTALRATARSGANVLQNDTVGQWVQNRRAQSSQDAARKAEEEKAQKAQEAAIV